MRIGLGPSLVIPFFFLSRLRESGETTCFFEIENT